MKKIIALFLALSCCLSLFGCKKQKEPTPTQATVEATEEAPTAAPTEAPTEGKTKATKATVAATKEQNKRPAATKTNSGMSTKVTTKATKAPTKTTAQATKVPTKETAPNHTHTFGEWILQEASTCVVAGKEVRRCSECDFFEERALPLEEHKLDATNICRGCRQVIFDDDETLVELGVVCDAWYGSGNTANYVWDIKYWNGKVYRGAGDYGKNSGDTTILAYNIATRIWEKTGSAKDEAVHGFVEIGGTLVAPGIDSREGWDYGNYYMLQADGKWKKFRNLPNGVHCFDMIECGGKIFAGLGTETVSKTVAVSEDGGNKFSFAPLYKDGKVYSPSGAEFSRTYEFVKYNGQVYALVYFHGDVSVEWEVFRYEDGKMQYVAEGYKLAGGYGVSRKYFGGEFEFDGACYIVSGSLNMVTDFSAPETWKRIPMPGKENVVDAFVADGAIYVMAYTPNKDPDTQDVKSFKTVIYKSTTGKEGSFQEVLSFDYVNTPISFDWDGKHFYIGTGSSLVSAKTGMVLRVKPQK